MNKQALPEGYTTDARGRLVPESMVKPIDQLRDQTINGVIKSAKKLQDHMKAFKAEAFADVATFVKTSLEQYDVKVGGDKGNVTLITFDGRYKIIRAVQENVRFDERLQAAKELIDECLRDWTADSNDYVKALVIDAFKVDQAGNVRTGSVLGLRRVAINDPKWLRAMQAIADSVCVAGSKTYIRLYERVGDTDRYEAIPLDLAVL